MEKDINKMTENLALMGRSVMRLDETQGDSFFLCVAREMALYQDADWDTSIDNLRKQLANYIYKNEFAQVCQMMNYFTFNKICLQKCNTKMQIKKNC